MRQPGPTAPPRLGWRSLRAKLLVYSILLVAVPGVVFALLAFNVARRALEVTIGRQLAEVARDAAEIVATEIRGQQRQLRSWAWQDLMRGIGDGDAEGNIRQLLHTQAAADARHVALLCANVDGTIVAASDPRLIGGQRGTRDWYRRALAGEEVVHGPRLSQRYQRQVLELAVPIRVGGKDAPITGVLLLLYDWERNTDLLFGLRETLHELESPIDLLLLDSEPRIIGGAWRPYLDAAATGSLTQAGWRLPTLRNANPDQQSYGLEPAVDALAGYAPLDDPLRGWTALALRPTQEAFSAVFLLQRWWIVLLAGVLLAAIATAILWSRRIVGPLQRLTEATRTLALDEVRTAPLRLEAHDEIGILAEAFDEMTERLTRAQRELTTAARFALMGEMAAGIAHDVRTPLGVLRSSAQLLGRSLPQDSTHRELTDMMVTEVDRLERVVAGMLALARPREPHFAPTLLTDLLQRAAEFVANQANDRRVEVRTELGQPQAPAWCDSEQIYQVLLNLLMNALQASSAGGHIVLRPCSDSEHVGFEVADDGPGIADDVQERIFTPFFTTRAEGTGLGLALVQRMVKLHRGQLTVDSVVGRGTTFRVLLQRAA